MQVPHASSTQASCAAVLHVFQAREELVAHGRIGSRPPACTNAKRALRSAILEPRRAASRASSPRPARRARASSSARSASSCLGERQARHPVTSCARCCSSHATVSVVVAQRSAARRTTRLSGWWSWPLVEAGAQQRFELRRERARSSAAVKRQNAVRTSSSMLDRIQLVGFLRQRREELRRAFARARTRPSSIDSHSVTSADPRVSGSGIVCSDGVSDSRASRDRARNRRSRARRRSAGPTVGAGEPVASARASSWSRARRRTACDRPARLRRRRRRAPAARSGCGPAGRRSRSNASLSILPPVEVDGAIVGRPRSSTQAWLHAARSTSCATSSTLIRSGPRRVAERVRLQVLAQAVAELVGADQQLELPHDDRRLLVDDRAVERARFVQVRERLADRIGALGAVDVVRRRVVLKQEPQVVVHLGKRRDSRSSPP